MPRATETEIAFAVLQIAAEHPNSIATFKRIYAAIPGMVNLSAGDLEVSITRPNEAMWQQIVRNIRSHYGAEGNFINLGYLTSVPHVGYRATDAGKAHLRSRGIDC